MSYHPNPMEVLLIDNYDSFTYNLYDYFLQLGVEVRVERNDTLALEDYFRLSCDAVVLSPGPQTPQEAGHLLSIVDYFHDKKPILGICLGHQAIGAYFGAVVDRATLPMHGKTSTLYHQGDPLFKNLPAAYEVMRYHSLILEELADTPLQTIATTETKEVMAIRHHSLPLWGVQFHPESILTEHGLALLANWLDAAQQSIPQQS